MSCHAMPCILVTRHEGICSVFRLLPEPPREERRRFRWQQSLLMTRTCRSWSHGSHSDQAGRCGGKLMWSLIVHTAPTRWRGRLVEVVLASGVMRTGGRYLKHKLYVASGFVASFILDVRGCGILRHCQDEGCIPSDGGIILFLNNVCG